MATSTTNEFVSCITPYKIPSRIGIEEILRVNLIDKGDQFYAFPLPRGASIYSSLANADGLVQVPGISRALMKARQSPANFLETKVN